jgi:hypothetical protein
VCLGAEAPALRKRKLLPGLVSPGNSVDQGIRAGKYKEGRRKSLGKIG